MTPSHLTPRCGECSVCPLCPVITRREQATLGWAPWRFYPKGAMLFWEGEAVEHVFILCAGRVRLFFHTPEGEEFTWKYSDVEQVWGYTGLLCQKPSTLSAQAVTDCLVRVIGVGEFRRLLHTEPDFHAWIDAFMAEELHWTRLQLRELGCRIPTVQRVARLLLRLTSGQGDGARIEPTVARRGQMVGLKHRAMTRYLNQLRRDGLIQGRGVWFSSRTGERSRRWPESADVARSAAGVEVNGEALFESR